MQKLEINKIDVRGDEKSPSLRLLEVEEWAELAEKLTARSDSVWGLLTANGIVIGVRKIRPKNGGV